MLEQLAKFLEEVEGFSATIYKDSGGVDTIGIGTLWKKGMPTKVTKEEARAMCINDAKSRLAALEKLCKVQINDNQRIALVSFMYNLGISALQKSTLLKKLNAGNYLGAAEEFLRWNKDNGVIVKGLTNRRVKERAKFLEDIKGS